MAMNERRSMSHRNLADKYCRPNVSGVIKMGNHEQRTGLTPRRHESNRDNKGAPSARQQPQQQPVQNRPMAGMLVKPGHAE